MTKADSQQSQNHLFTITCSLIKGLLSILFNRHLREG